MKKHLLYITALLFTSLSFAQVTITFPDESVDLTGTTQVVYAPLGVDSKIDLHVNNLTGSEKYWKIRRVRLTTPPSGWQDYVCWGLVGDQFGGTCYAHSDANPWSTIDPVQHVNNNTGAVISGLLNNESALASLHCKPSNTVGGTVTYRYFVYQEGGPDEDSIDVTYTTVASLKEIKTVPVTMSAYPNPASSTLTVATTGIEDDFVVRVSDVLGKVVYEEVATATKKVDVSDFKNGVYLITVINNGSVVQTKRVVVKH